MCQVNTGKHKFGAAGGGIITSQKTFRTCFQFSNAVSKRSLDQIPRGCLYSPPQIPRLCPLSLEFQKLVEEARGGGAQTGKQRKGESPIKIPMMEDHLSAAWSLSYPS